MISLWEEATYDAEQEAQRERLVGARVATRGVWPFLVQASCQDDFRTRLNLVWDRVTAALRAQGYDDTERSRLEASLYQDFKVVEKERRKLASSMEDAYRHGWEHSGSAEEGIKSWAERYPRHNDVSHHNKVRQGYQDAHRFKQREHAISKLKGIRPGIYVPASLRRLGKDYDEAIRKRMADSGEALSDGSFPIADCGDVEDAVHRAHQGSDPGAAKAHILKRWESLGCGGTKPFTSDSDKESSLHKGSPFAGYSDFQDCLSKNQDKDSAERYCGKILHQVEGSKEGTFKVALFICHGCQKTFGRVEGADLSCPTCHHDRSVFRCPKVASITVDRASLGILDNGVKEAYARGIPDPRGPQMPRSNHKKGGLLREVGPDEAMIGLRVRKGDKEGLIIADTGTGQVKVVWDDSDVTVEGYEDLSRVSSRKSTGRDHTSSKTAQADVHCISCAGPVEPENIHPAWGLFQVCKWCEDHYPLSSTPVPADVSVQRYKERMDAQWAASLSPGDVLDLTAVGIQGWGRVLSVHASNPNLLRMQHESGVEFDLDRRRFNSLEDRAGKPLWLPRSQAVKYLVDEYDQDVLVQTHEYDTIPEASAKADEIRARGGTYVGRTKHESPRKTAGDVPPWLKKKDNGDSDQNGNASDSSSNDSESDGDESNGDDQGLAPPNMQPGQKVIISFTMPDGTTGTAEATFESTQGATYFFKYVNGRFGVTQGQGGWVDSKGATFTFAASGEAPDQGGDKDSNTNGGSKPPFPPKGSRRTADAIPTRVSPPPVNPPPEGTGTPLDVMDDPAQQGLTDRPMTTRPRQRPSGGQFSQPPVQPVNQSIIRSPMAAKTTDHAWVWEDGERTAAPNPCDHFIPGGPDGNDPLTCANCFWTIGAHEYVVGGPSPVGDIPWSERQKRMGSQTTTAGVMDYYDVVVHRVGGEASVAEHGTADLNEAVNKAKEWHNNPEAARVWVINRGSGDVFWSDGKSNPEARFSFTRSA